MNYYYVFTMPDGTWLPARFRIEDRLTCRISPIQFASEMQAELFWEITRAVYLAMRSERCCEVWAQIGRTMAAGMAAAIKKG